MARHVDATRAGRLVFGIGLLIGPLLLAKIVATAFLAAPTFLAATHARPGVYGLLAWTWTLATLAGLVAYAVVRRMRPGAVHVSGTASFVAPAVGIAALLPITVHALIAGVLGTSSDSFDEWAMFALALTSTTHLGFACMVGVRAAQLARGRIALSIRDVVAWTLVLASVPVGLVSLMLPTIVVACTGLPIVPLLVRMERLAPAHRDADVPVARVVAMV
jgi:hypothetical protein